MDNNTDEQNLKRCEEIATELRKINRMARRFEYGFTAMGEQTAEYWGSVELEMFYISALANGALTAQNFASELKRLSENGFPSEGFESAAAHLAALLEVILKFNRGTHGGSKPKR